MPPNNQNQQQFPPTRQPSPPRFGPNGVYPGFSGQSATPPGMPVYLPAPQPRRTSRTKIIFIGIVIACLLILSFAVVPRIFDDRKEVFIPRTELTFKVPPELQSVTFNTSYIGEARPDDPNSARFITVQLPELAQTKEWCAASRSKPPMGNIYRVPGKYENTGDRSVAKGRLIKQFDNFFVTYDTPPSACADIAQIEDRAAALRPELETALKKSLKIQQR